ncbi:NACHT and WD repeat domain-containing protein [Streptomyces sp. NBC_00005]|uniref:NACHT and WD repeat domain-containing protein n=1 Tax=Streptomyces sp. NBC_00005 TaxID=2903609 RepID=UPI0032553BEE
MSAPEDVSSDGEPGGLDARASDSARIYQAGRDQYIAERDLHVHYETGVRRARRATAPTPTAECPYPGLAAFAEDQSSWFFGRDAVTADLLVRLDERLRYGGALVVVAPSGAGKSSILRAGLLPALARGALPAAESARWPRVHLTPTAHPSTALFAHLAQAVGVNPQNAYAALSIGSQKCVAVLHAAIAGAGQSGRRLVLVVDQLEELFTLCGSEQERRDFLDVLTGLARSQPDGAGPMALVVLGLRSDFYTPCADYPQLRSALQERQLVVGSMTQSELREAITFPARAVGLEVEPGLVELLLRDLGVHASGTTRPLSRGDPAQGYEAGRLPLLAHALRATWQQRHGHVLTVEGYQATGGIRSAITTTAERIFHSLQPEEQKIARPIFLRLVKIGDGVEDTRRQVPRADLIDMGPGPATVVAAFTNGRLLTQHQDTIEITHEALLGAWPRLRDWIEADRAGHLLHQDLEESAAAWTRSHHDSGMLYRGQRLEAVRVWANRSHHTHFSPVTSAFLGASIHHSRRGTRIRRAAIAVLTALALIASTAAVLAFQQRSRAQAQRDEAVFSQVKAEAGGMRSSQASLAAQLNLTAHRMRPDDPDLRTRLIEDASRPLSRPLAGGSGPFHDVGFSPDGDLLAAGSDDGSVQLWRFTDSDAIEPIGRAASDAYDGPVNAVAFSPEGGLLATANNDGSVRLFDVADPAHPRQLGHTPTTSRAVGPAAVGVSISHDGRVMVKATNGEQVQSWDISDPRRPRLLSRTPASPDVWAISSVAFSPTGRYLAGGSSDGSAQLWDMRDPSAPVPLGHTTDVPASDVYEAEGGVSFSPDEKTLASAGGDGFVRLWDVSDKSRLTLLGSPLQQQFSAATDVAFSPDGRTLASTTAAQYVCIWNLADLEDVPLMESLRGHLIGANALAFRPSDGSLVTAGADPAPLLWQLPRTVMNRDAGLVMVESFAPDRTMVTVSGDGAIRRWSIRNVAHPEILESGRFDRPSRDTPIEEWPQVVALNSGGDAMAVARKATGVELWDIADLRHPALVGTLPKTRDAVFTSLAFSPDGHLLAGGDQLSPWIWDVTDPPHTKLVKRLPRSGAGLIHMDQLAFSPDGHLLAALNGPEKQVSLWDVRDPAHPDLVGRTHRISADGEYAVAMAFSPKGNLIATGSDKGRIRLWTVSDAGVPSFAGATDVPTGDVATVAFSPDERILATGGGDSMLRLWDVSKPSKPAAFGEPLTGHTRTIDTVSFAPNAPVLVSDSYDGTVRLWPTETSFDIDLVCKACASTLTRNQWRLHMHGLPYDPPCLAAPRT